MEWLQPAPQPIGLFDTFTARQTEVLVIDEKLLSLSGDSFDIRLANGMPLLKVKGSVLSLSGRKDVTDMLGNHMFTISKKILSLHATFAVTNGTGQLIMEVKNSLVQLIGSKATITFTSRTGKYETLVMRGNWRSSKADIVDEATGLVVARIKRDRTAKHYLMGAQTYTVTIAPGVDMALVAAMCICLDEKNE
ncbi:hypothetical protein SAPIO_CDS5696 [Scedosporium apiospermum]|uniref:DUF567 domain protein n=1 Tax=Pseudallescheria apiosperma TaxID=563466 RepID=A0A084G574_PSEDA|nr:uncharacterized protein SAPIO_CDS5696 [Scedosporium apiospermum]KEZ42486.1 hypothetical protein SAPIO_CDS5696 [Scedosporium apiospermum]